MQARPCGECLAALSESDRVMPTDHPIANEHLLPPLSPTTAAIHRAAWGKVHAVLLRAVTSCDATLCVLRRNVARCNVARAACLTRVRRMTGAERLSDREASAFVRLPPPPRATAASAGASGATGWAAAPSRPMLATCTACRAALSAPVLAGAAGAAPTVQVAMRSLRRVISCADRNERFRARVQWTARGLRGALTRYFRLALRAQSSVPLLTVPIKFNGRGANAQRPAPMELTRGAR
jgi:hypothetical protein